MSHLKEKQRPYSFWIWHKAVEEDVEDINQYKLGGLCPIHLGDQLDNGTYTIVYKAGETPKATIWIAQDNKHDRLNNSSQHPYELVALKIHAAEMHAHCRELEIFKRLGEEADPREHKSLHAEHLPDAPTPAPLERHRPAVMRLIHTFNHDSVNGTHQVLVMPIVRPLRELEQYANESPENLLGIARQLSGAVAFLHSRGIVHGDLHSGNVGYLCDSFSMKELLFKLDEPLLHTTAMFQSVHWHTEYDCPCMDESFPLVAKNPELTAHVPKYLVSSEPWRKEAEEFPEFRESPRLCVFDFDGAFMLDCPPDELPPVSMVRACTPPEYIFPTHEIGRDDGHFTYWLNGPQRRYGDAKGVLGEVNEQADVWMLGCLLARFACSPRTFTISDMFGCPKVDELLQLDPDLPETWKECPDYARALEKIDGSLTQAHEKKWSDITSGICRPPDDGQQPLESQPIDQSQRRKVADAIKFALRFDPQKRPLASAVLQKLLES